MSQPPIPLVTLKSDRGRVLGMSLTYTCLHFHSHAPYEPPLAASDLLGLVHGHFREKALSGLAVLADTSLGRATHTALNEPASLLGTKHLLPLDQSRRKDLMSHLAHEARSWNYAKGRGWEFGCLAPTLSYLTGALSGSRGL